MNCFNCGKKLSRVQDKSDEYVCLTCGNKETIQSNKFFCEKCGKRLKKIKTENDSFICLGCGNRQVIKNGDEKDIEKSILIWKIISIVAPILGLLSMLLSIFIKDGKTVFLVIDIIVFYLLVILSTEAWGCVRELKIASRAIRFIKSNNGATIDDLVKFVRKMFCYPRGSDRMPSEKQIATFFKKVNSWIEKGYLLGYKVEDNSVVKIEKDDK